MKRVVFWEIVIISLLMMGLYFFFFCVLGGFEFFQNLDVESLTSGELSVFYFAWMQGWSESLTVVLGVTFFNWLVSIIPWRKIFKRKSPAPIDSE